MTQALTIAHKRQKCSTCGHEINNIEIEKWTRSRRTYPKSCLCDEYDVNKPQCFFCDEEILATKDDKRTAECGCARWRWHRGDGAWRFWKYKPSNDPRGECRCSVWFFYEEGDWYFLCHKPSIIDLRARAERHIARSSTLALDVCSSRSQMFHNVKGMEWLVLAVMDELEDWR